MVNASAFVETGIAVAFIDVDLAALAGVTGSAVAPVVIDQVHAAAAVLARVGPAIVLIDLTESSAESDWTDAGEGVHTILAGGTIQTVVRFAVVDVKLTSENDSTA